MDRRTFIKGVGAAGVLPVAMPALAQSEPVKVSFFYPIAVGGAVAKIVDGYAEEFNKANPSIVVTPVYAGTYQETLVKVLTAHKSGTPPPLSVLLSTDMFTLIDEDAIEPIDGLIKADADKAWLQSFFPAFMSNSQTEGKTWAIPFQRSTIVLYWNKEAFKDAGLDPDKAPATWEEHLAFAQKLTKRDTGGAVVQWGTQIPSSGFPYWLLQALAIQSGDVLASVDGKRTTFTAPGVAEGLQYWLELSQKHKVHAPGVVEWGTTPKDFFERKTAMMWTTTGNLTNVRNNAKFPFGVAMLPANRRRGSPTGGGNFVIAKKASAAQKDAALKFAQWLTQPERAAQWSIDTGYVAVTPAAYETSRMKDYLASFPASAVARDQLAHAVAELSTRENQRVTKALNDNVQAVLSGSKAVQAALNDAQGESERILKTYR